MLELPLLRRKRRREGEGHEHLKGGAEAPGGSDRWEAPGAVQALGEVETHLHHLGEVLLQLGLALQPGLLRGAGVVGGVAPPPAATA